MEPIQVSLEPIQVLPTNCNSSTEETPKPEYGWLTKHSRSTQGIFSNWRKRYFILEKGKITYYEDIDMFKDIPIGEKGNLNLSTAKLVSTEDPLTISISAGREDFDMLLKAENETDASRWRTAIKLHIRYYALGAAGERLKSATLANLGYEPKRVVPPSKEGFLTKKSRSHQGILSNWKKRYIILSEGKIKYYDDYDQFMNLPLVEKGCVDLSSSEVLALDDELVIAVSTPTNSMNDIFMRADTAEEAKSWRDAVKAHCVYYSTEIPHPQTGWLMKRARTGFITNWKKRYVVLCSGKFQYYEEFDENANLPLNKKGEMDLMHGQLRQEPLPDSSDGDEELALIITIKCLDHKEADLVLKAETLEEANMWKSSISEHCSYYGTGLLNSKKTPERETMLYSYIDGAVPKEKNGWLIKKPRGFMNSVWKRRYFTLSEGVIQYFDHYDDEEETATEKRGEMLLAGAKLITSEIDDQFTIVSRIGIKDMTLEIPFPESASEWKQAIREHCAFATKNRAGILKKIDIFQNSVAAFRENFYGYTAISQHIKISVQSRMSDEAIKQFKLAAERLHIFIISAPFSSRVLGYLIGVCLWVFGFFRFFYCFFQLQLVNSIVSFGIFLSGIVIIGYEYKFHMMPFRFFLALYKEMRIIFYPYGRVFMYLFLGSLVGSFGSFSSVFEIETLLLASYITFNALFILYNTYSARTVYLKFRELNIEKKLLQKAFNKTDKDKNGELDLNEIREFLEYLDVDMSVDTTEIFMLEMDRTLNGLISWEELARWYASRDDFIQFNS